VSTTAFGRSDPYLPAIELPSTTNQCLIFLIIFKVGRGRESLFEIDFIDIQLSK
jgi:hypothetical protein